MSPSLIRANRSNCEEPKASTEGSSLRAVTRAVARTGRAGGRACVGVTNGNAHPDPVSPTADAISPG
jgi:hypothetical protein